MYIVAQDFILSTLIIRSLVKIYFSIEGKPQQLPSGFSGVFICILLFVFEGIVLYFAGAMQLIFKG